jgi:hypothetical protein
MNVFDRPCTFDGAWDSRDYLLEECWNCGGEGYVANCQDEAACLDPESGCDLCTRRCEFCNPAQADRSPEGEKPQALNAKHESAVANGDAPEGGVR